MRHRSSKTQDAYDEFGDQRVEYCLDHECQCLWCCQTPVSVHEIARGVLRMKAFKVPACWLCLCWDCNSGQFNNRAIWPEARQLALKLIRDPKNYDLDKFNEVFEGMYAPITQDEVKVYEQELRENEPAQVRWQKGRYPKIGS